MLKSKNKNRSQTVLHNSQLHLCTWTCKCTSTKRNKCFDLQSVSLWWMLWVTACSNSGPSPRNQIHWAQNHDTLLSSVQWIPAPPSPPPSSSITPTWLMYSHLSYAHSHIVWGRSAWWLLCVSAGLKKNIKKKKKKTQRDIPQSCQTRFPSSTNPFFGRKRVLIWLGLQRSPRLAHWYARPRRYSPSCSAHLLSNRESHDFPAAVRTLQVSGAPEHQYIRQHALLIICQLLFDYQRNNTTHILCVRIQADAILHWLQGLLDHMGESHDWPEWEICLPKWCRRVSLLAGIELKGTVKTQNITINTHL